MDRARAKRKHFRGSKRLGQKKVSSTLLADWKQAVHRFSPRSLAEVSSRRKTLSCSFGCFGWCRSSKKKDSVLTGEASQQALKLQQGIHCCYFSSEK